MTLANGVASVRLLSYMLHSWSVRMRMVIVTAQAALMNPRRLVIASTLNDYGPHCSLILIFYVVRYPGERFDADGSLIVDDSIEVD